MDALFRNTRLFYRIRSTRPTTMTLLPLVEIVLALLILLLTLRVIALHRRATRQFDAQWRSRPTSSGIPGTGHTHHWNHQEHPMHESANHIPLARLTVGQRATIVRVGGAQTTRRRLRDMGMVTGETVTLKAVAPLGDPVELTVKGYHLSLRKHEANEILVEVCV
jgi:ferrous iron transport protein A